MTSYSKVFKAPDLSVLDEIKIIQQPLILPNHQAGSAGSAAQPEGPAGDMDPDKEQSREQAREIIGKAKEQAAAIEAAAEEKISQWWTGNEKKLEAMSEEAREQGFSAGYSEGLEQSKQAILQEYEGRMEQVQRLLEQAYDQKEAIIAEAEPFLLELSLAIASRIVRQELDSYPEKFVDLIRQHILRFKEKEFITVCVHPDDFDFIQEQRALLIEVVNGETEIKIIPDHTVTPRGCIIRTAYGSVDARIDTQIDEIKKVILEARREPENDTGN